MPVLKSYYFVMKKQRFTLNDSKETDQTDCKIRSRNNFKLQNEQIGWDKF